MVAASPWVGARSSIRRRTWSNGKELFVNKCASCHTLAHANAQGTVGPNLDDAFRQDRADGVKSTSIQGLVELLDPVPEHRRA